MNHPMDGERPEQVLDRGDFLKLLGAAGIGVAAGTSVFPGTAEGAVRTGLDPTDFSFRTREQFRPFHLLAKNFVELDDSFDRNTIDNYMVLRPAPPEDGEDDGFVRVGDGEARFAGQDDYYTVLKSNTGQEAPFSTVIVDVASQPDGTVYAGLYRDELEYVHAYYNKDTQTVGLEARVNGQLYQLGSTQQFEQRLFEAPFRFAFVANENEVTALVSSSSDLGNFRPLIKRDLRFETGDALDLRDTRGQRS